MRHTFVLYDESSNSPGSMCFGGEDEINRSALGEWLLKCFIHLWDITYHH